LIRLFNCPWIRLRKLWSIPMNTCELSSLSDILISLRGGWRRWI
jgi:hypothetical protein